MTCKIIWSEDARKQLRKLDKKLQVDVIRYLSERIANANDPYDFGKPLQHNKYGLWRYRVGDIRIICQINDKECMVLVLNIGHRKYIYK